MPSKETCGSARILRERRRAGPMVGRPDPLGRTSRLVPVASWLGPPSTRRPALCVSRRRDRGCCREASRWPGGRSSTRRTSSGHDRDVGSAGDVQVSRRGPESSFESRPCASPGALSYRWSFLIFVDIFLFYLLNKTDFYSKNTLHGARCRLIIKNTSDYPPE